MNKPPRMQKCWAWIMGAITLVITLFFPPFWGHSSRIAGFFWQLLNLSPSSSLLQVILQTPFFDWLILFFPPCALTACTIWLWSRQMPWDPTIFRGMVVTLEAIGLALLATAVFFVVVFIIPAGNGWGMAIALFNIMWASIAFVAFLPGLLITATVLAHLQRNHQVVGYGMRSRV